MPVERAEKPGLQGERTELSWERTAIGFLAIAAVVLFRHHGPLAEGRTGLAQACFDFLPARAELDLAGWPEVDIFAHV